MFSLMGTAVFAQEAEAEVSASSSVEAGLSEEEVAAATADEALESSSGIFLDKFRAAFAKKEKKARIKTVIAAKKMQKLRERAEKNPEVLDDSVREYEKELESALESFDEIAVNGEKEQIIAALKETVIMKYRLETQESKVPEVHARILERQSEKMTEEQIAHLTEVFSRIDGKIDSRKARVEERQENLIARAVVVTDLTEEVIRAKLEAFEQSLDERREARAVKTAEHKSSLAKEKSTAVERAKERAKARASAESGAQISTPGKVRVSSETDVEVEAGDSGTGEVSATGVIVLN